MSDIVQRLRRKTVAGQPVFPTPLDIEAANEIERLRARVGRDVGDFDYPPGSAPCMCFFSTAEDRGPDPLGECDYHKALRSRLAEEARRHTEQTVELVNLAEGRRVRLAEAEALLRDIYSYAEDQGMETLMDMIDSADSADAAQIVTISEHLDESVNHGWVIEGAWSHVQTPDYWVGSSAWSQDHNRALRFARKQDAEQAAAMMLDGIRVRFCEHAWTARE